MISDPETQGINTIQEKSIHVSLKAWYAQPGDRLEVKVDSFVVDIVREDLLIEIQTRNFSALRGKLAALMVNYPVRLVYPVAEQHWIVKMDSESGCELSRRKSPKRGHIVHVFYELVSISLLATHPNFSLEVLLVHDEEIRCNDGKGSWRRKGWSICDRRLLAIIDRTIFLRPTDFVRLLPPALPDEFTTADLAAGLNQPRALAQKMTYCLRHMGLVDITNRRGNALVYRLSAADGA